VYSLNIHTDKTLCVKRHEGFQIEEKNEKARLEHDGAPTADRRLCGITASTSTCSCVFIILILISQGERFPNAGVTAGQKLPGQWSSTGK